MRLRRKSRKRQYIFSTGLTILSLILTGWFFSGNSAGADEDIFTVRRIGQMICYAQNAFSVQAPEDGDFSVRIYDEFCTYRIISRQVSKGTTEIVWDGCGYNGERLDTKYYYFDFCLKGISGQRYTYQFRSPIVENAQHLQFVLPSSETAYLTDPSDWFIEVKSVRNGTIAVELIPDGETEEPSYSFSRTVHMGRVEHLTLEKLAGKKLPDPGTYTMNVYEVSRPDETTSFTLQIAAGPEKKMPVTITGNIMPARDADDRQFWQAMMEPSVVVDIDPMKHQNVFNEPDPASGSLGTLHGQTQGLEVMEIRNDWARIGAWNHEDAEYIEGWVPMNCLKIAEPNSEFGLLVDKKEQTITVFRKGERLETLLVSTGRMERGKYDRETSAGCYLTGLHRVDFSTQGLKYDFVIQYDGGNLLHQIPYSSDGKRDFTQGKAYLGAKASHACIRIQDEPGFQNGINAYWIWTHIPYRTKIIILDDPEERRAEKARLSQEKPIERNKEKQASSAAPENGIVLTFAGSVIPGGTEQTFGHPAGFEAFFRQSGADIPLEGLRSLFSGDDLTCVSLGCVLTGDGMNADPYRSHRYRGLPEYAEIFSNSSVELVSMGDDHLLDYRQSGFDATAEAVGEIVPWVGPDAPRIVEIKGHLFGLAVIMQQEYLKDTGVIKREICKLKNAGCEYVIVQCYWGNEKETMHGKLQEAMARACAREGADLVIGHHPEAVQGMDEINGMPVFYSLGRMISDVSVRTGTYDALAVQAIFHPEQPDEKPAIRLIPLLSAADREQKNNYRPVPAEKEDINRILNTIQKDTGYMLAGYETE